MNTPSLVCISFRILVVLCIWNCTITNASDMNYIPDDWVDPTDMRHYDRFSKSMKMDTSSKTTNEDGPNTNPPLKNRSPPNEIELKRYGIFVERFINRILFAADLKVSLPKTT